MTETKFPRLAAGYDTSGTKVGYRCGTCASWNKDKTCSIVAGQLEPTDCCNYWSSRNRTVLKEKISKANAVVVDTPVASHKCGICHYWQSPGSCSIVMGLLNAEASCVLWTDKGMGVAV